MEFLQTPVLWRRLFACWQVYALYHTTYEIRTRRARMRRSSPTDELITSSTGAIPVHSGTNASNYAFDGTDQPRRLTAHGSGRAEF